MFHCSDKGYFAFLLILHAIVCCLSVGAAIIMGLNRSLTNYKCYLFARQYSFDGEYYDAGDSLPCTIMTYMYSVVAGWSLLSIVCHGLCTCWRKVEICLRVGFGLAAVIALLSWVSSVVLTIGFVTWCQWVVSNATFPSLRGCLVAAEKFDLSHNVTDMETFYYLSTGAQGCGWLVSVICVCLAVTYLQCCCCKVRSEEIPITVEDDDHVNVVNSDIAQGETNDRRGLVPS